MALAYIYAHKEEYEKRLEAESERSITLAKPSPMPLNAFSEGAMLRRATEVISRVEGRRLDIVYQTQQPEEGREEAIFTVTGYITQAVLPPIRESMRAFAKPESAGQWIELTGLGSKAFKDSATAIGLIRNLLCDDAPPGSLAEWHPRHDGETFPRLRFSNRYLSTASDYNNDIEEVPKDQLTNVDPKGILASYAMHGKHRMDNEVLYFERITSVDGRRSYEKIKPGSIRAGYLVELQVTFSALQASRRANHFNMIHKLRSVCVLDREAEDRQTMSLISSRVQARHVHPEPGPSVSIRRRVGYSTTQSEDDEAVQELKRMRLSTENAMDDSDAPL